MRKYGLILLALAAIRVASAAGAPDGADPRRYVWCRNGEIQLLPALEPGEMRKGHRENLEALGGFVFNIEWRENKVAKMRVLSKKGGVCRVRSYGAFGSPLMRKAKGRCANAELAATEGLPAGGDMPESCFERAKNPLPSVCLEFDTEPGEILEFRGQAGNQDWTDYAAHLDDRFLKTGAAAHIAQNVIDWQLDSGGWPKNVPMHERLSAKERRTVLAMKSDRKRGTIDNAATYTELKFLARMYKAGKARETEDAKRKPGESDECRAYIEAVERGIEFLAGMQYKNGGWPQCDPAKTGYWHQITYNDGAMVNAMKLMGDVGESNSPFDIPLPGVLREKCRRAFDRGVECILDTQIRQDGKLALWCQQHDRDTLAPCIGRSFELPAVCTYESADIVALLMDVDETRYPAETAARIRESIEGAVAWYRAHAIRGYRIEEGFRREDGIVTSRLVRVPEEKSKPLWCRYYTLEDNRPFTGRRDGTMNFDFSELERGENMSYKWFSDTGTRVEKMYAKWRECGFLTKRGQTPKPEKGNVEENTKEPIVLECAAGESLQRTLDAIPEESLRPVVVRVAPGRYREKVRLSGRRSGVKLVATDARPGKTVISWNDTPSTPDGKGGTLGTFRSCTFYVDIPDFEMDGFTVENTGTPERLAATGGKEQAGQCVALFAAGDRNVFRRCRFLGWQDTVYTGGEVCGFAARQAFDGCYIEGTVDFIFGGSVALFWNCDIHSIEGGYVTAGSHSPELPFGYVFAKCRVTCGKGKKTSLGRPWRPYANITFIDSDFGDAVTPEGWNDWTTEFGLCVWRSAEYGCRQKGETKRRATVEIGGAKELRRRLKECGCSKVFDIIAGADGWRPLKK